MQDHSAGSSCRNSFSGNHLPTASPLKIQTPQDDSGCHEILPLIEHDFDDDNCLASKKTLLAPNIIASVAANDVTGCRV